MRSARSAAERRSSSMRGLRPNRSRRCARCSSAGVNRSSPAADIGFTLPHEHTAIALWHIPNRWDYWELSRDEEIAAAELARFRAAGGSCLVDLTLSGVGRNPARLAGLSEQTGLHIVMGAG